MVLTIAAWLVSSEHCLSHTFSDQYSLGSVQFLGGAGPFRIVDHLMKVLTFQRGWDAYPLDANVVIFTLALCFVIRVDHSRRTILNGEYTFTF